MCVQNGHRERSSESPDRRLLSFVQVRVGIPEGAEAEAWREWNRKPQLFGERMISKEKKRKQQERKGEETENRAEKKRKTQGRECLMVPDCV